MTPIMVDVLFVGGVVGVDPKISVLGGDCVGVGTFIATGATISNILFSFKEDTYIKIPLTSQFQKQRIRKEYLPRQAAFMISYTKLSISENSAIKNTWVQFGLLATS